jgi:hypothetical protein
LDTLFCREALPWALFADFNEALARSESRATAGNVRRQHEGALISLDELMQRVAQFYALRDAPVHQARHSVAAWSAAASGT